RYLNQDEIARLTHFDIALSRRGLTFRKTLDASQLRTVWQAVSAINRRKPKSEEGVNWLIGDWANETDNRLGKGAAERIVREEEEVYRHTQHQLRLAGGTLVALQWTELAIGTCLRLLEPEHATVKTEDVLSSEAVKRGRTLGQLNKLLKDRELFVEE